MSTRIQHCCVCCCPAGKSIEMRVQACKEVVVNLPQLNYEVLDYLVEFLTKVRHTLMYTHTCFLYLRPSVSAVDVPLAHWDMIKSTDTHTHTHTQVVDNEELNKMTALNLAIVFGPNLIWCYNEAASLISLGEINSFTYVLLEHYDEIFTRQFSV